MPYFHCIEVELARSLAGRLPQVAHLRASGPEAKGERIPRGSLCLPGTRKGQLQRCVSYCGNAVTLLKYFGHPSGLYGDLVQPRPASQAYNLR